jgi:hypothetical protein
MIILAVALGLIAIWQLLGLWNLVHRERRPHVLRVNLVITLAIVATLVWALVSVLS